MLGNLHVRFGVGAGVKIPGLHHLEKVAKEGKLNVLLGEKGLADRVVNLL